MRRSKWMKQTLKKPYRYFLHFLHRRIKAYDYPFNSKDELDFLMYYFSEGLFFEDGKLNNLDEVSPSGYTDKLDRYYHFKAGLVSSGEKPILQILHLHLFYEDEKRAYENKK